MHYVRAALANHGVRDASKQTQHAEVMVGPTHMEGEHKFMDLLDTPQSHAVTTH